MFNLYNYSSAMRTQHLAFILLTFLIAFSGCKKYNQIDNAATIVKPYVLYVGGYNGTVHKTNDGVYFNMLFPVDNSPVRQILTADSNLIYLKQNCYVSLDEGFAFNVVSTDAMPYVDLFYKKFLPNNLLFAPHNLKTYLCTNAGLVESIDDGESFANTGAPITPTSITKTDNDSIWGLDANIALMQSDGFSAFTTVGQTTPLPTDTALWYLTHFGDEVFAVDFNGHAGVYRASAGGSEWTKVNGVAGTNRDIIFCNHPEGSKYLFLGRDSARLYRMDPLTSNAFAVSTTGIPAEAKVSYVEGKTQIYRTGDIKHFLYCATDVGLYRSEDDGDSWIKVWDGNFSTLN